MRGARRRNAIGATTALVWNNSSMNGRALTPLDIETAIGLIAKSDRTRHVGSRKIRDAGGVSRRNDTGVTIVLALRRGQMAIEALVKSDRMRLGVMRNKPGATTDTRKSATGATIVSALVGNTQVAADRRQEDSDTCSSFTMFDPQWRLLIRRGERGCRS